MYSSMLATVIAQEFEERVGRGQNRFPTQRALDVEFKTSVDFDREEGYRYIDLRIWAPGNYVAVVARRRWNVIAQEDLVWDEEREEDVIRRGADYTEGASPWYLLSYHDSGWRDAIRSLLSEHQREIHAFGGLTRWAAMTELTDADVEALEALIRGPHLTGRTLPEGFTFQPAKL